jgi:hypothetical protein
MDITILILFATTWIFIIINFIITNKKIEQLEKIIWIVEDELAYIKAVVRAVEDKEKDIFLNIRDIIYKFDKLAAILYRILDRECDKTRGENK